MTERFFVNRTAYCIGQVRLGLLPYPHFSYYCSHPGPQGRPTGRPCGPPRADVREPVKIRLFASSENAYTHARVGECNAVE